MPNTGNNDDTTVEEPNNTPSNPDDTQNPDNPSGTEDGNEEENPSTDPEDGPSTPSDPIDPPREPTPAESDLLSSIGYSATTASEQTLSSIVTAIEDTLDNNSLISGQPYNINYSNNGTTVVGYITINRKNIPETWESTITSFSITGTTNNIDYTLYGNAEINSDYQSNPNFPFISCEINISNYAGDATEWYGALITAGKITETRKDLKISFDMKANDDDGKSHTWKATMTQINETTIEQSQTLDGISLTFPTTGYSL